MSDPNENSVNPDHPHGPPDPRWITDDGRCLLCADTWHKAEIQRLEKSLTVARSAAMRAEARHKRTLAALMALDHRVHSAYDFNADPDGMTLFVGAVFADVDADNRTQATTKNP